ncbi:MAG: NAD(+)/NADH kinase [Acidimicrobiia bacterium]|nr:NAD(+)/NADH kinase [Acidimicrobiia bacterium]
MRLGLVVNREREEAVEFETRFEEAAEVVGCETLALDQESPSTPPDWDEVDAVVAIGGDGTVLNATRRAMLTGTPVLGINLGTLGFLAEAEPEQLDEVLAALTSGDYTIEERNTIEATIGDVSEPGLNDVVVEKIESQRLVVLDVEVNGERFLTYRADGIVVATSTGSTAYGFSAGGPLIDPRVETLLVTPVAPHSLFDRSLVMPPDSRIVITVTDDRPVRVSVDGREIGSLHEGEFVEIGPADRRARFIRLSNEGFATRVTRKFGLE